MARWISYKFSSNAQIAKPEEWNLNRRRNRKTREAGNSVKPAPQAEEVWSPRQSRGLHGFLKRFHTERIQHFAFPDPPSAGDAYSILQIVERAG